VRILVVGGTSFIGRHTVAELLRRDHEVTIFHRGGTPSPFNSRVRELIGDRQVPDSVAEVLRKHRFDGVVDLAYDWQQGTGAKEVSHFVKALSPSCPRYVFTSSVAAYRNSRLPLTEDSPRGGHSFWGSYGVNKSQAESTLEGAHLSGALSLTIVRPVLVYGQYNPIPRESWFWDRMAAGRPVILPDDGSTQFQWVAAPDVAWTLAESLTNEHAIGQAFNVAEPSPVTHEQFVDRLARASRMNVEKVKVPRARLKEAGGSPMGPKCYFGVALDFGEDFAADTSKVQRTLGFRSTDPDAGLKLTYDWYSGEKRELVTDFSLEQRIIGR
jgi:nucleoside-diphosphate-sugar epimerase